MKEFGQLPYIRGWFLLWKPYMHHTLLQRVDFNSKSLATGCHFSSIHYLKCFINLMTSWALRKSHLSVF